jgi:hypothetical protein
MVRREPRTDRASAETGHPERYRNDAGQSWTTQPEQQHHNRRNDGREEQNGHRNPTRTRVEHTEFAGNTSHGEHTSLGTTGFDPRQRRTKHNARGTRHGEHPNRHMEPLRIPLHHVKARAQRG